MVPDVISKLSGAYFASKGVSALPLVDSQHNFQLGNPPREIPCFSQVNLAVKKLVVMVMFPASIVPGHVAKAPFMEADTMLWEHCVELNFPGHRRSPVVASGHL
jgi:hypothetical protein